MSVKPSLLIFGAGINQLELIREARSLGLTGIVIDPQDNPPGKPEADFFYQVSGSDYELTRDIAIRHKVRGIITGQTEKPLRLMARLAEEMGIIFNSPEVTDRCIDKWQMKEAFRKGNITCAGGMLIKRDENIPEKLSVGITYPLILKPRDSFSSRGVYKCDNPEEVKAHLEDPGPFLQVVMSCLKSSLMERNTVLRQSPAGERLPLYSSLKSLLLPIPILLKQATSSPLIFRPRKKRPFQQ